MNAKELIGKEAVRTAPIFYKREVSSMSMMGTTTKKVPDYSYCDTPILIVNATDTHIVYYRKQFGEETYTKKPNILDCRYCDNNWTDYNKLINNLPIMQCGLTYFTVSTRPTK